EVPATTLQHATPRCYPRSVQFVASGASAAAEHQVQITHLTTGWTSWVAGVGMPMAVRKFEIAFLGMPAMDELTRYANRPIAFLGRYMRRRAVAHAAIVIAVLIAVGCSVGT